MKHLTDNFRDNFMKTPMLSDKTIRILVDVVQAIGICWIGFVLILLIWFRN